MADSPVAAGVSNGQPRRNTMMAAFIVGSCVVKILSVSLAGRLGGFRGLDLINLAITVGLIHSEAPSAGCRRLGHITKQGNTLLRFLLVEAAQATVRCEPEWRRRFMHLALRRDRRIAKVAMARKLAVRMYWMWRKGCDYPQLLKFGSHVGQ